MKTLIVGAGAIGTLLGAYMTRGGADVTMLDLPETAARLNKGSVEIRTNSEVSFKVRLKAVDDSRLLKDIDFVIVCVKTFHTDEAVSSIAHLRDRIQAVVSIQNGVDKEDILERYFGRDKVIGGCCLEAATREDKMIIRHTMSVITYVGELDGTVTPRVKTAVKMMNDGGLKAEASTNVVSADWCKWINFAAGSAICGLTGLPYYSALLNPHSADLIAQLYCEYADLAAACGVEVDDYPGFEVKTIARASREEAVRILNKRGEDLKAKGATQVMASLARDLIAGRPTERESIFGFALREAEVKDVAMPLTRHVYALMSALEQGREY